MTTLQTCIWLPQLLVDRGTGPFGSDSSPVLRRLASADHSPLPLLKDRQPPQDVLMPRKRMMNCGGYLTEQQLNHRLIKPGGPVFCWFSRNPASSAADYLDQMGSSGGISSSSFTGQYVSWFVDSAESPVPAPPTHASTLQDVPEKNQGAAGSSKPPLFLPSSPETCGVDMSTFPQKCPQGTFLRRKAFRRTRPGLLLTDFHSPANHSEKERKSDQAEKHLNIFTSSKEEPKPQERNILNKENPLPLSSGGGNYLLPRSSPVLSRRPRPLSWHGRRTPPADPSSLELPSSSSDSAPVKASSEENLGARSSRLTFPVQEDEDRISIGLPSDRISIGLPSDRISIGLPSDRSSILSSCSEPESVDGESWQLFQSRRNEDGCRSSSCDKDSVFSGVSDFTADMFKACWELEKENAHFIVVDMVLEVLEGAKWSLSLDQTIALMENMEQNAHTHSAPHKHNCKPHSKHGGEPERNMHRPSEGHFRRSHTPRDKPTEGRDDEESRDDRPELQPKMCSVLSTDSGFEDCGLDTTLLSTQSDLNSAEDLAQRLVSQFKRKWLPSHKLWRGRLSLRSSLQELPGTEAAVSSRGSLTEEIQIRTRMRGSRTWAPPCFQIIFTLHPAHRRSEMVALQNFLCAGCGTEVEPRYIKKLRYCEYLGRYFCDCCHGGSEAVIPARILSGWDFSRYSVSDFSKHLLDSVWHEPLFDLTCVGTTLCSRVKELSKFRDLQEQLMGIKKLLKACRFSRRVLAEFEQFPTHLTEAPLFFSMNDLLRAKKGQLAAPARALLLSAISHIESCELCLSRGFICEFCRQKEVIFPFQRNICKRCKVCRACFHKRCFIGRNCPKCARIQSRLKVQMCP